MTCARLENLNVLLLNSKLDAVILNPGPTLTYLTGVQFHLMERPVVLFVVPGKDPVLVLPELEIPKVDLFPYKIQAFAYGELPSQWDDAFRKAAQALSLDGKQIGVEPRQLRLLESNYVKTGAPEADYLDASSVLSRLRLKKDKAEVDAMRRAVKIAQDALEATLPLIKIGMEGHEDPYIRGDNMQLLEVGMAYTVEPGIYLTNRNGVRIEDNMIITENGVESLSDMPREIRVVG
jgi:Xaa-Pro dipeptidase